MLIPNCLPSFKIGFYKSKCFSSQDTPSGQLVRAKARKGSPGSESELAAEGSQKVDGRKTLFLDTVDRGAGRGGTTGNSVSRQDRQAWERFSHLRAHLQAPLQCCRGWGWGSAS